MTSIKYTTDRLRAGWTIAWAFAGLLVVGIFLTPLYQDRSRTQTALLLASASLWGIGIVALNGVLL